MSIVLRMVHYEEDEDFSDVSGWVSSRAGLAQYGTSEDHYTKGDCVARICIKGLAPVLMAVQNFTRETVDGVRVNV